MRTGPAQDDTPSGLAAHACQRTMKPTLTPMYHLLHDVLGLNWTEIALLARGKQPNVHSGRNNLKTPPQFKGPLSRALETMCQVMSERIRIESRAARSSDALAMARITLMRAQLEYARTVLASPLR